METFDHFRDGAKRFARVTTLVGFIAGIIWIVGLRVLMYSPHITHYHANFAVYVNGAQLELKDPTFYEEVASCTTTNTMEPKSRVHLHDQKAHLVHVHDDASTWGHLFANIGMTLGNTVLKTRSETLVDGTDGKKLTFYLNGEQVPTIANRVIESEDALLISYGTASTDQIKQWYEAIPRDAAESNTKPDPSSCSGPSNYSFIDRAKKALDITK